MSDRKVHSGRHTLDGAFWGLIAQALMVPTGLATVIYLTRTMGPGGYGQYAVVLTIITWLEFAIVAMFSRTTVKLVSDAEPWRPAATTLVRLSLMTGLLLAGLLWLGADVIAAAADAPHLAWPLRLAAVDIPLFALAQGHISVMIARGQFRHRALVTAGRWLVRLALIVLLVELGFGLRGAILGCIGASVTELALARWYCRPPLRRRGSVTLRRIWQYAAPLAVAGVSFRLLDGLDLLAWKALGATEAQAGIYAAALSLALMPGILSLACSVLLLSSLARLLREQRDDEARKLGRDAWWAILLLMPFAFLLAASGTELSVLLFGPAFEAAGPLLALLVFAGVGRLLISLGISMLTAYGRPGLASALVGPLVPLSLFGYVLVIPALGATGAAVVSIAVCLLGGLVCSAAVTRQSGIVPPVSTLMRSAVVCGVIFALGELWATPGPLVLLKLTTLALLTPALFVLVGELSTKRLHAMIAARRRPAANIGEVGGPA